jgi:hypothetical protein
MTVAGDGALLPTATARTWLDEARPRLRPAVRVGPALSRGPATIHFLADCDTQAYLQVGPREAFLMARLDGTRTLNEIGAEYAMRFGRRLAVTHWQQLMSLLASHELLDPGNPARLSQIREKAALARQSAGRSPLRWRIAIPRAVDLVPPVARRLGWLLKPPIAVPLALAGLLVCIFSLLNVATLYTVQTQASWPVRLLGFVIAWTTVGFHELGHGMACDRYGGRPTQIGLLWRFPFVAFYCKVDDVVVFGRTSHRIATAFAGVYINLVCLVPAGLMWQWGPGSGWLHSLTSVLLLFGAATVAVNLLPVLHLDGYHMLEHATSTHQLQWESARFAGAVLRHGRAGLSGYPHRVRWIYAGYAVLCAAILGTGLFFLLTLWYSTLAGLWGRPAAALVLLAEAVLLATFLRWAVHRRSRRSAKV